MAWLQLKIPTTREQSGCVEDALLESGALSVTLEDRADQPILEPAVDETPLWDQVVITGLFSADAPTAQISADLSASLDTETHSWEILEDKDWEREWMARFEPIPCGDKLWICPSWKSPPNPQATNLLLDPGLAFGTGTHPTTFLCLNWLDTLNLAGKTVLDFGCGSGILGIAALLLGAESAVFVDNDPQALIATEENARRNNIPGGKISLFLPEDFPGNHRNREDSARTTFDPSTFDIVLANILAEPLIALAPTLTDSLKATGAICLSGIIMEQGTTIRAHYEPHIVFDEPVSRDEWIRLTGTKV
ncbi:MAG: 50S ribosomal protein L11 methyltransferase [bacterium]